MPIRSWSVLALTSFVTSPCPLSWMLVHAYSISFQTVQSSHNSEIYTHFAHAHWSAWTGMAWQRSGSDERPPIAYWGGSELTCSTSINIPPWLAPHLCWRKNSWNSPSGFVPQLNILLGNAMIIKHNCKIRLCQKEILLQLRSYRVPKCDVIKKKIQHFHDFYELILVDILKFQIIAWSIEYQSDDVIKKIFFQHFHDFFSSYFGRAWWKTSTRHIWYESVHGGPRYGRMNTKLAPLKSV